MIIEDEDFKEWASRQGFPQTDWSNMFQAWEERNKVIDAFIHDNSLMFARSEAIKQENVTLKAENARLHQELSVFDLAQECLNADTDEEHD